MISDEQYLQFSPFFAREDIEKEEDRLKFLGLLSTLPQAVRDLLASENTTEKILNISGDFELDEFDTEALSLVVRKLATGEVSIVQGTELVTREVGLPEEKANELLNLIINEILTPVIGNVKRVAPVQKQPERSDLSSPRSDLEKSDPRVIDLRNR